MTTITFIDAIILLGAGFIGGGLNAIVGGGAFVAFPTLIFLGIPSIPANATVTVSLWLGTLSSLWAQRKELLLHTRMLPLFIPLSLVGGGIGAVILITMSNAHFSSMVPVLLLVATVLFSFSPQLIKWVRRQSVPAKHASVIYWSMVVVTQLAISIYGGFFGAGMGILFLAFFGMIGIHNMHEANAVRNCSGACLNSVATIVFIVSGKIVWLHMVFMAAGGIIGGYVVAHHARKFPSGNLRKAVIVVAWAMTVYFFLKQY